MSAKSDLNLMSAVARVAPSPVARDAGTGWRDGLPQLVGELVTLRELQPGDAPALMAAMASSEVARFISPPPSTLGGFERVIEWAHRERANGRFVCFAVVPHGSTEAVGLFQMKQLEKDFLTAEWGFALGSTHWGTGIFADAARLLIDFAIDVVGVERLEARAAAANGRGNGALRKIGAVQEGVLRRSLVKGGRRIDQVLWSILADEWRLGAPAARGTVVH